MKVTADQMKRFAPRAARSPGELAAAVNLAVDKAQLNTDRRLRYFLTQTSFETGGYRKFEEDLFYTTPERLAEIFARRISLTPRPGFGLASDYIRQPQKLANFVYANRYGNGGPETNDGWNFRGQGCIHTTFRDNYLAFSMSMYGDDRLVRNPGLIQTTEAGMLSAAFFWTSKGLNALADSDSFTEVTRRINGSAATVPERLEVLKVANTIF
jgi:putative chitinase